MVFLFICIAGAIFIKDQKQRKITFTLCFASIVSLLVFSLQMKGFFYHIMPFYALAFPLCAVIIYRAVRGIFKTKERPIYTIIACLLICGIYYHRAELNYKAPDHEFYKNNQISNYIDSHCAKPCSFYITYMNMDIISQLAFYSPHEYATRFPTFWFLIRKGKTDKNGNIQSPFSPRFTKMITEDIKNFKPTLILDIKPKSEKRKSIISYLNETNEFHTVFQNYKKIDTININRKEFYAGSPYGYDFIIEWEVYKYEQ